MRSGEIGNTWLRIAPALTLLAFMGPVLAGLTGTLLPAFGYLPGLGGTSLSIAFWGDFGDYPGVGSAVWRSFWTGMLATVLSLAIVVIFAASWRGQRVFVWLHRGLAPILSVPHSAVALGLLFLLAPSGWIMRLVSPWATGFERPPDLALAPDPYGLVFVLGLVVKEIPFLLLMMLSGLNQIPERQSVTLSRSLGYSAMIGWIKIVLPQLYPVMRLPIYAVLAYSVSVVDMAVVLLPATSPTLGLLVMRWFNDPDLTYQFLAAVGATVQLGLVVGAIVIWWGAERVVAAFARPWLSAGGRGKLSRVLALPGLGLATLAWGLGAASVAGMIIWSFAHRWRFPDALPRAYSLGNWVNKTDGLLDPALVTLVTGGVAACIALFLVVSCLENEQRNRLNPGRHLLWLLYLPLLIPQVAFLFGAQALLVAFRLDGSWMAIIWAHLLFVLPYLFLSLSDPYRRLDPRYRVTALSLGQSQSRVFWTITLPLLLRPILIALAVGFAVSVGQYLPTIFAGGGRFATLTTEAVTLAGNGDRRLIGLYVFAQSFLPFLGFGIAALWPLWRFRNRRGMRGLV